MVQCATQYRPAGARSRLNGIDCPEKSQAYGKKAKQAASAHVFGKEVTLQTYGEDKYGRKIADVLLPDGTNVNHALVKDGWCWWYRKYAPTNTELEKLEKEAREGKSGRREREDRLSLSGVVLRERTKYDLMLAVASKQPSPFETCAVRHLRQRRPSFRKIMRPHMRLYLLHLQST